MSSDGTLGLLREYRAGRLSQGKLLDHLRHLPYQDLGFARVDHHRSLRRNFPEVIYARGKTLSQICSIARALHRAGNPVMATKVDPALAEAVQKRLPWLRYFPGAGILAAAGARPSRRPARRDRFILVVSAGTSDIPVAEEAAVTLELMGRRVRRLFDVGVAGLHRLLAHRSLLRRAHVLVVAAGMDGVLPSVISGLVARPVVAVPTSVGYGASFKGIGPLLTMLNSCSPGVAVVNVDNGFGAGYLAAMMTQDS